jgi:hypothetical protein
MQACPKCNHSTFVETTKDVSRKPNLILIILLFVIFSFINIVFGLAFLVIGTALMAIAFLFGNYKTRTKFQGRCLDCGYKINKTY